MATAFISDLHLNPEHTDSAIWFDEFMSGANHHFSKIYILGDLFDYWIGDDAADVLGQTNVLEQIKRVVDSGVELFFIHGNRDFLVGQQFENETGCRILPDPSIIRLGDESILLSHGDMLCTDDIEHQKKRAQMITSKWKYAFLEKPVNERLNTAQTMRNTSEMNKQNKPMEIMDVAQSAVEALMKAHGVQTIIHGHTHRPAVHDFELDGQPARRYVLGDWYTQKSMLIYDRGAFTLRR